MKHRYENIKKAITEALRVSNKVVHYSTKCFPHVRSFVEYIPIEVYAEPKQKIATIVSINEKTEKPTLPMTIQKKWDIYRQSSVKGIKLVLHGSEAQIIDIMELEQDYSEIAELLPFDFEISRCKSCFVSEHAIEYGMIRA